MTPIRMIYVTAPSVEKAEEIARALLDQRLIACANIVPAMRSIYRWKGQVEAATEVVLLLKTTIDKVNAAIRAVETLHDYDVPCALAIHVESGSAGYINWLIGEIHP